MCTDQNEYGVYQVPPKCFRLCDACTDPDNFPDDTVELAVNYCRNPTQDGAGSYCYTPDGKQDCDIPNCLSEGKLVSYIFYTMF